MQIVVHLSRVSVLGEAVRVILGDSLLAATVSSKYATKEATRTLLLIVGTGAGHVGLVFVVGVLGVGHLHLGRRVGVPLLTLVIAAER